MIHGFTFSNKYAKYLGFEPTKLLKQILIDFRFESIRLCAYWDELEPQEGKFNFEVLKEQLEILKSSELRVTIALGRKVPRWPEYHLPEWIAKQSQEIVMQKLYKYIHELLIFLSDFKIDYIQVENEPLFDFGLSSNKVTKQELLYEINFVKNIANFPIIITETGEGRDWNEAYGLTEKLGINLYSIIYDKLLSRYHKYGFKSDFYKEKIDQLHASQALDKIFVAELQAEPWTPGAMKDYDLTEWKKSMNNKILSDNYKLAQEIGFKEIWFWGVEWWYAVKNLDQQFFNEAKKIVNKS